MTDTVKDILDFVKSHPPKAEYYDYTMMAGGKFVAYLQDSIRRDLGMSDNLVKALREAEGIPEGSYIFSSKDIMKIRK